MFLIGKALWFLFTPSNLLTLLVLGGVVAGLSRPGSRKPFAIAAIGAVGLALCGFGPVGFWLARPLETRFPPAQPLPAEVAGFIVLGGGVRLEDSTRSDTLTVNDAGNRILSLGDLARRYPAAKIVMSGGSGNLFDDAGTEAEAELVQRHAGMLGVDPARIIVENRSRSTYENALDTRKLVRPGDGEVWLLVTSAWHMPRAVGAFRQAGFPVTAYPVDFRAPGKSYAWRTFAEMARGLRLTDSMAKEWVGLVAYRLMGHTDALLPGPWDRGRPARP
ncbi:Uncharacterized SAM-binding protein YcdF, DUF218 family [Rhizobiales bacterium GAS191]|nr:Uncharacterized SAM-binding protein YcdF, DUF218 family [Rhizobiales bacterium GAS191]